MAATIKCSRGPSRYAFSDLPDDCCFELFAFLPLPDQVRFMRINQRFGALIAAHLRRRTAITIDSNFAIRGQKQRCSEYDLYRMMRRDEHCRRVRALSVLRRLPNLRSLTWSRLPLTAKFGRVLAQLCPLLEEITISECGHAEGLLTYASTVADNRIRALNMKSLDNYSLIDTVMKCPRLVHLTSDRVANSSELIKLKGRMLKSLALEINAFNEQQAVQAVATCSELVSLKFYSSDPVNHSCLQLLAANLLKLHSIEVTLSAHDVPLLSNFANLSSIDLRPRYIADGQRYEADDMRSLLQRKSNQLVKLALRDCDLSGQFFKELTVAFNCLRSVEIEFLQSSVFDDECTHFLRRCPILRKLRLVRTRLTAVGVERILNYCPKLCHIEIFYTKSLLTDGKRAVDLITSFAHEHPRRHVYVAMPMPCERDLFKRLPANLQVINKF